MQWNETSVSRIEQVMKICADYENSPADIIADLMHWCKKNLHDFNHATETAKDYVAGDLEDKSQFPGAPNKKD